MTKENDQPFSKEYVSGATRTDAGPSEAAPEKGLSIPVDERRYGLAKPYRITIRGKLIHDRDEDRTG